MNVIEFTLGIQSTKQIDSSTVCFEISYGQQEFSPFTKVNGVVCRCTIEYRISGLKPKNRGFLEMAKSEDSENITHVEFVRFLAI